MRRHISHSYISADWASLKWPRRRQYTGFKFHGCLWEREFADNRHDGPAAALGKSCVWKSVPSPAMLAWFSLTKINRCSHCQIQYSETGSALQQCDSGHVNDSTVLESRSWDDRRRRQTPVTATAPATGHPRLETSKAVTALFLRLARHPASRVGQSCALRHSQHEAYCRPNLGDILDTRLPRNLILERDKKFRDSSRSRLVNIPNTDPYEQSSITAVHRTDHRNGFGHISKVIYHKNVKMMIQVNVKLNKSHITIKLKCKTK